MWCSLNKQQVSSAELAVSHIVYLSFDLCTHYTAVLRFLSFIKSTSQTSYELNICSGSNHHKLLIYILRWRTVCAVDVLLHILKNASPDFHSTMSLQLYSISQCECWNVVPVAFNDAKTKEIVLIELISGCECFGDHIMSEGDICAARHINLNFVLREIERRINTKQQIK